MSFDALQERAGANPIPKPSAHVAAEGMRSLALNVASLTDGQEVVLVSGSAQESQDRLRAIGDAFGAMVADNSNSFEGELLFKDDLGNKYVIEAVSVGTGGQTVFNWGARGLNVLLPNEQLILKRILSLQLD